MESGSVPSSARVAAADSGRVQPQSGCMRGEQTERATAWWRWTALFVLSLFGLRLTYAYFVPLDLVHDEAYYWEWSRRPDWGYYSKPPMVAWLIHLATALGGNVAWVVRWPAITLGTLGLFWVYALGSRVFSPRVGFWATILAALNPGNGALSLLMTIDAPLLFCWGAALYLAWRCLSDESPSWLGWGALTLALGCGFLSKQTMLGFGPLLIGFLATNRHDWAWFRRPQLWCVAILSLLFLLPVLYWNSQNGWITAQHTGEHFSTTSVSLLRQVVRGFEFLGSQIGVVSPLTWFLICWAAILGLRNWRRLERRERYLVWMSILPLLVVAALSFKQRVEPNWPAPFYAAAIVLVVGWVLERRWATWATAMWRPAPVWLPRAAAVGAVCLLVAYVIPFASLLAGSRLDPTVRLRGWRELATAVDRQRKLIPSAEATFLLVHANRALASELAFYLPEQPEVYMYSGGTRASSQYDIWGGPNDKTGWNALILTNPEAELPAEIRDAFGAIERAELVEVPIGNNRSHRCQIWRGREFRAWPTAEPQVARTQPHGERWVR